MGGIAAWFDPRTSFRGFFTQEGAFGLNPLNIGGAVSEDRDPFTAPGTTGKRDALDAEAKIAAENAQVIADAEALKSKSASQAKESILSRQRAISRNKTTFTDPLGLSGTASTVKKTLTGQ